MVAWTPQTIYLDGRRKTRQARSRQLDERLVALRDRDDESIEISVSWSCVTYAGQGHITPPLTIQVDARPAAL
jgi:hypothetical protein